MKQSILAKLRREARKNHEKMLVETSFTQPVRKEASCNSHSPKEYGITEEVEPKHDSLNEYLVKHFVMVKGRADKKSKEHQLFESKEKKLTTINSLTNRYNPALHFPVYTS
ncbi:hypothetical protein GCK72_014771 [Caenorhabditis remanei]|uniref:Uncharacterized protein n=1 Tax=Caenorhabditis remanei TaxID=31234 RepID=A0A6A5GV13_CAERE|nr:hypothetical protein GCK72_014771 [Caenorhabditis remanei]KAF1758313.1 hypothetical protein GCK72_014771 [Caenorhabditis remanei]